MYRIIGKYPYTSQLLSVLLVMESHSSVCQIDTGQDKGISAALNDFMLCFHGDPFAISIANMNLASREFGDFQYFFQVAGTDCSLLLSSAVPSPLS